MTYVSKPSSRRSTPRSHSAAAGLEFVVAPLRTTEGRSVRRLDDRYSIALLPFVDGVAGAFGDARDRAARNDLLDRLIELHRASDRVRGAAPVIDLELAERPAIAAAFAHMDEPWTGGPYSDRTRTWLYLHAADLSELVRKLEGLVQRTEAAVGRRVITHGEPHPGNVIQTPARLVLIDWDTAGLALPERDLWLVVDDADDCERYAEATGHRPDPNALALFALRWQLADIGIYLDVLRSPHVESADTEQSWLNLDRCLQIALAL